VRGVGTSFTSWRFVVESGHIEGQFSAAWRAAAVGDGTTRLFGRLWCSALRVLSTLYLRRVDTALLSFQAKSFTV